MNDELYMDALKAADDVVVTPHALKRGYDEAELAEIARSLPGSVYLDTDEGTYHLVTADTVLVMDVRDETRVVITAYPRGESPRYQLNQYRLLRG